MNFNSGKTVSKGKAREASLQRDIYFAQGYFELSQLCSFAHQISLLHSLNPKTLLEVGMGNGFTSSFLIRSGVDVTTVDINPNLDPDICCDLQDLPSVLSKSFDVVSCCEVLEHMPWMDFEKNVAVLRGFSDVLFLSLPYGKIIVGMGGFFRLPNNKYVKVPTNKIMGLWASLPFRQKTLPPEHFWELDHSSETSIKAVKKVLSRYYSRVSCGVFELNPYHRYFICRA